jgi:hypothetical protein
MRPAYRLRQLVNDANGTTLCGLVVARVGDAALSRGPDGLIVGTGYRFSFPRGSAFTLGNVVISRRSRRRLLGDSQLMLHEDRHSSQYAVLGPAYLPLYLLAVAWSYLRTGDHWSRNLFERHAGLTDGHYVERPLRSAWSAWSAWSACRRERAAA